MEGWKDRWIADWLEGREGTVRAGRCWAGSAMAVKAGLSQGGDEGTGRRGTE